MITMITLKVGRIESLANGVRQDGTRDVEFEGEEVGRRTIYGYSDRTGKPTDTRGITETLYRAADGRLLVYTEDWSCWAGEGNDYALVVATPEDLGPTGPFAGLGHEAGFGRPLTLDEVLEEG